MEVELIKEAGFWSGVITLLVLQVFAYFLYTKITKKKISFTGGSAGGSTTPNIHKK